MADVKLKECDIFETLSKQNKGVRVLFTQITGPDGGLAPGLALFDKTMDMSPRAIERAKNFLDRATSPPPKAKADA